MFIISTFIRSSFGLFAVLASFLPRAPRLVHIMSPTMSVLAKAAAPAAQALQATLQVVVPKIRKIIGECEKSPTGKMQPSVDEIVQMCSQEGSAERRNVMHTIFRDRSHTTEDANHIPNKIGMIRYAICS